MADVLNVRMLGGFSLEYGANSVDDQNNRMRKVWLLLACLIYSRSTRMSQEQFISLLQHGADESADPNGKLKAVFYRLRTMLNALAPSAGHDWIIRKNGTYAWNTEVPLRLDVEEFEQLCTAAAAAEGEEQKKLYLRALELYRGDFLPKLSMESWVVPISAYYHRMYLTAAENTLSLLAAEGDWAQTLSVCRRALNLEPYSEMLYQYLMRGLIALDDRAGAVQAYEDMSEVLFATFGVMPSDESRLLYREASREAERVTVPTGTVREQLKEPVAAKGALYCEYDFFRMLYQLQARSIVRTGDIIHIALFSVHGRGRKELPRRSLDRAMDNFQEILVSNLRQGDVVTRCSISQFIVMLPQANYENSCGVCQRILKAFGRQYPHSPVEIRSTVHPLEPVERP